MQGTPFYGYEPSTKLFVQIFLYDPRSTASVVQTLESGCIAERRFQTFESHIPFLLQVLRQRRHLGFCWDEKHVQ